MNQSTKHSGLKQNTNRPKLMKNKLVLIVSFAAALLPSTLRAEEPNQWTFDVSLYGLAASMSGNVVVKGIPADVDAGFDKIWDNLKFGAMGSVRVGYGRWGLSTEVIYMDLKGVKGPFTASAQQWLVQPALEYSVCQHLGVYAGTRYNNLALKLNGPLGRNPSGTQEWWDPILGAQASLPIWKTISFHVKGDIGGFDVGSKLTWQAFPYFNWQISKLASVQAGYRLLYTDYETGSGLNKFKYDMLTSGPQVGFTLHF
jgi:hypothetical protein